MAVDIDGSGPVLTAGTPHALFDVPYVGGSQFFDGYVFGFAISGDGQRFLAPVSPRVSSQDAGANPIAVVLNWSATLKK